MKIRVNVVKEFLSKESAFPKGKDLDFFVKVIDEDGDPAFKNVPQVLYFCHTSMVKSHSNVIQLYDFL